MKKILIVDDELLLLNSLTAALRKEDISVTAASCGEVALDAIKKTYYDLCFLDINLPDANGLDIMKILLETSPKTIIIIMSSDQLEDDVHKTILKTACCFLPKPFDLLHVRSLVNSFLREKTAAGNDTVLLPHSQNSCNGTANKTV